MNVVGSASTSIQIICWPDLSTWPRAAAGVSRAVTQVVVATGSQVTTALPSSARSAWSTNRSVTPAGAGWTVITREGPETGGSEPSEIVACSVIGRCRARGQLQLDEARGGRARRQGREHALELPSADRAAPGRVVHARERHPGRERDHHGGRRAGRGLTQRRGPQAPAPRIDPGPAWRRHPHRCRPPPGWRRRDRRKPARRCRSSRRSGGWRWSAAGGAVVAAVVSVVPGRGGGDRRGGRTGRRRPGTPSLVAAPRAPPAAGAVVAVGGVGGAAARPGTGRRAAPGPAPRPVARCRPPTTATAPEPRRVRRVSRRGPRFPR